MFIQTLLLTSVIVAAPQAAGPSGPDAAFVKKAAEGGTAEVALAKLAQEKASNADVKSFAAKLEKDHSQANDDLKEVASKKNITLSATSSKSHQPTHDRLAKLSGAEFDKAYVAAMLESHQKGVRDFSNVASGSGDAEVKAFASKTLPTLKDHLQQVQELSKAIGAKKPTS